MRLDLPVSGVHAPRGPAKRTGRPTCRAHRSSRDGSAAAPAVGAAGATVGTIVVAIAVGIVVYDIGDLVDGGDGVL